ncbi:MAG TPA: sensor domain-containing diguanylate cyclase [Arcobacter sp.]|nr:sensor domain-containing diguanylate cyclase [Arcobacter sp.]
MFENDKLIAIENFKIFEVDDLNTLLHKILNYAKKVTGAEAGTIYLKDNDNNLRFNIFQNDTFPYEKIYNFQLPLKNMKLEILEDSPSLAVACFNQAKIICVDDIYDESKYDFSKSKEFDVNNSYKTKSILCVPLINHNNNKVIGVLQLINKQNKEKTKKIIFTQEDKEFISLSSYFITLSIISTKDNIEQLKQYNNELETKVKERTKELEETQKELLNQVNHDALTKLYNRRYFNDIIKNLMKISQRDKKPLVIAMIDIDDFKLVNDTYGHAVGDVAIQTIAEVFNKTIRTSDISIRFGGEEFVIIFPDTVIDNTKIICEKLRSKIESSLIKIDENRNFSLTVSIGLSQIELNDINEDKALYKADKALYKAKKQGKNQVDILT